MSSLFNGLYSKPLLAATGSASAVSTTTSTSTPPRKPTKIAPLISVPVPRPSTGNNTNSTSNSNSSSGTPSSRRTLAKLPNTNNNANGAVTNMKKSTKLASANSTRPSTSSTNSSSGTENSRSVPQSIPPPLRPTLDIPGSFLNFSNRNLESVPNAAYDTVISTITNNANTTSTSSTSANGSNNTYFRVDLSNNSALSSESIGSFLSYPVPQSTSSSLISSSNMIMSNLLVELKLIRCNISSLPASFFSACTTLQRIYLDYNNLTEFPSLSTCTKLNFLSISNNSITNIPISSVPQNTKNQMTFLDISSNRIRSLEFLKEFRNLQTLIANHNPLFSMGNSTSTSSSNGSNNSSTKVLDLSSLMYLEECELNSTFVTSNNINTNNSSTSSNNSKTGSNGSIPFSHIQFPSNLEILSLNSNNIDRYLASSRTPFREFRNLKELYLTENNLTNSTLATLSSTFSTLEILDLTANKLSNFPQLLEILDQFPNLKKLYCTKNSFYSSHENSTTTNSSNNLSINQDDHLLTQLQSSPLSSRLEEFNGKTLLSSSLNSELDMELEIEEKLFLHDNSTSATDSTITNTSSISRRADYYEIEHDLSVAKMNLDDIRAKFKQTLKNTRERCNLGDENSNTTMSSSSNSITRANSTID